MSAPTSSTWPRLRRWCLSRNWRLLVLGLPALAAGAALLVLAWFAATTPSAEMRTRYHREGKAAYARQEYARALTCYERLAPEGADQPDVLFQLALAAEKAGQTDRAVGLMTELAPHKRRGYAPAHLWWAQQLVLRWRQPEQLRAAEVHLVRALDGELEDPEEAHALLGQLYADRGRLDEAELHLQKAVKSRPYLRLWLARLYAQRKDFARARQEAQMAVNFYRGRAKADLNDHRARLSWADALTALEDFAGAVAVLEEGLAATRDAIYSATLARVYLAWYEDRKRDSRATSGELLDLLSKGLAHDATNKDLLNRLLAGLGKPGKEADEARAALEKMLASGKATAFAHFALSVDAFQRNKPAEGRFHLERAHEIEPRMPVVANNLAWTLAQSDKPDLPRALSLADLAVEQEPNNPAWRDTRGHVYLKMGRLKEAVADLEVALSRAPDNPTLHRSLADAYEKLGNDRLAAEHRRIAGRPPVRQ